MTDSKRKSIQDWYGDLLHHCDPKFNDLGQ